MRKIPLVILREYLTRVKKKSFIIMTLLAPFLISGFYALMIWISINDNVGSSVKHMVVVDQSGIFGNDVKSNDKIDFHFSPNFSRDSLINSDYEGMIIVPEDYDIEQDLNLKYESQSSLSVKEIDVIQNAFSSVIRNTKLKKSGITQETLDSLKVNVAVQSSKIDSEGNSKTTNSIILTAVGIGSAFIIYIFIFLYGVQVMRGVIEEKTSRIVELMVSSVKPFELMMGKVIGIAAVGLTQLAIWGVLSTVLTLIITTVFGINQVDQSQLTEMQQAQTQVTPQVGEMIASIADLPIAKIFGLFLFFFIAGYLLYGAIFAAIGSAVDSETDTQQFMMPITLPLVFSLVISFSVVINDPNGALATWLSMIPFTSPIVMMARLPFDPPTWQIVTAVLSMIIGIVIAIAIAGKIYRTGILMYGKKPSYKELLKWLFYKN
ncbi:ABC transporter permease [bacterium]|nr:ABC transporter permease [bacterium]